MQFDQKRDMKGFASSLGQVTVAREALACKTAGRAGVYDLSITAKINVLKSPEAL
jgi:hypothetical protein